jgi:hypothetical protein
LAVDGSVEKAKGVDGRTLSQIQMHILLAFFLSVSIFVDEGT